MTYGGILLIIAAVLSYDDYVVSVSLLLGGVSMILGDTNRRHKGC